MKKNKFYRLCYSAIVKDAFRNSFRYNVIWRLFIKIKSGIIKIIFSAYINTIGRSYIDLPF